MKTLGTGAGKVNLKLQIGSTKVIYVTFVDTDISTWTFQLFVKYNIGDRVKVITLSNGNGISFPVYSTDQIMISFSAVNTSIQEGEYYWQLHRTDLNIPILNGSAYFSYDAPEGSTSGETSFDITYQDEGVDL